MNTPLTFDLPTSNDTIAFGYALGRAISDAFMADTPLRTLLLFGELGSGKTTLIRGLVNALQGGENAEVCSPSFTVCNEYPTKPCVVHCDLYRNEDAQGFASGLPDEAWDALENKRGSLIIIEWAQRLRANDRPAESLDILLKSCQEKHLVTLAPHGEIALSIVQAVKGGF